MTTLLIAVGLVIVAAAVAVVLQRRRPEPPTQSTWEAPAQLDRDDFDDPTTPWLVVMFSSTACASCAEAWAKVRPLASADVAVQDVAYQTRRDLHERYAIDAAPTIVVAGPDGVVRASFIGAPPAADLWAAVSAARGERPEPPVGEA